MSREYSIFLRARKISELITHPIVPIKQQSRIYRLISFVCLPPPSADEIISTQYYTSSKYSPPHPRASSASSSATHNTHTAPPIISSLPHLTPRFHSRNLTHSLLQLYFTRQLRLLHISLSDRINPRPPTRPVPIPTALLFPLLSRSVLFLFAPNSNSVCPTFPPPTFEVVEPAAGA